MMRIINSSMNNFIELVPVTITTESTISIGREYDVVPVTMNMITILKKDEIDFDLGI